MELTFETVGCPDCGEHGSTRYGGKNCPRCKGSGHVLACTACGGDGAKSHVVSPGGRNEPRTREAYTCSHCEGTGAEPPPPPREL